MRFWNPIEQQMLGEVIAAILVQVYKPRRGFVKVNYLKEGASVFIPNIFEPIRRCAGVDLDQVPDLELHERQKSKIVRLREVEVLGTLGRNLLMLNPGMLW